ncbi:MAG TPA: EamA family transporter [Kofleriaceae bacterium]
MIIALVLLSALLHATWNALLRVEADKDRALVAAVSIATLLAAAVGGARWVSGEVPFATQLSLWWTVAAGVLEWLYFVSLAKALDRGSLGPVYTISRGGAILLVWPISIAFLGEPLTSASAIGSAVVFAGLALASSRSGDTRKTSRDALAWAIACAASIAGYHLAYKAALREGGSASAVFAVALAVASAINLVRLGSAGRRVVATLLRTRLPRLAVMGCICGGSFLILMEALAAGGAGFVLTLRNTSVLFAIGLAFAIGEHPRRVEIAGAALVAAGAVLMAWPT